MSDYSLTDTSFVIRKSDGASIPSDPMNSDRDRYNKWVADGGKPDPYVTPPQPAVQIRSQDMFALFSPADATKIQSAIATNVNFWLLWSALQAQTDPMLATSDRFKQGWAALISVLGKSRMNEIAVALYANVLIQ